MKVLHIFNSLMPSGAETMWAAAAPFLRERGIETHVAATLPDLGPYAERMQKAGFTVHHVPRRAKGHFDLAYYRRLYRFIKEERFEAVQIHPEGHRFCNCMIARLAGVKHLTTTIHNVFEFTGWRKGLRGLLMRILRKIGVHIIACSESVAQSEERYGYKPELIWNGIDLSRYIPRQMAREELDIRTQQKVMLSVGNCSRIKNHAFLFDVLQHLPDNWVWVHVGREEPGRPEFQEALRRRLQPRVRFLGVRNDVPDLMKLANVMVMPSLHEGFSLVGLESMLAGTPAVVAQMPGLVDVANMFGLCRSSPLDVDEFARQIESMNSLPKDLLKTYRCEARGLIDTRFDLRKNVARYIALWRGLS